MSYDECRRHLDPIRAHLETLKVLHISTAYKSQREGEPSAIFNLDAEYLGAYLRDDKLVVMMKFDDRKVDYQYVDVAYDGIRARTKKILVNTFPGLKEQDLAIYVIDSSGDVADIEFA